MIATDIYLDEFSQIKIDKYSIAFINNKKKINIKNINLRLMVCFFFR